MEQVIAMAALSLFPRIKPPKQSVQLRDVSITGFDGGLDLTANDLTLNSKFAKVLDNVVQDNDGTLSIRWGTKLFCDVTNVVTGQLLEIVYFNGALLAFTDGGEIARIDNSGTPTAIWNSTIAGLLPGTPDGWSAGQFYIDTSEFKGDLVVVNGQDKPLIISAGFSVKYLDDPATGSNVNTPIGRYVTTCGNYLVMAGISAALGSIYISSSGTSGVWPGDDPPNDSISYNLSSFVPENTNEIIGLASYRNSLIVAFEGSIVTVELGQYDDNDVHKPVVQDNIVEHGVINYRTMITAERDLVMADTTGWHLARKNTFGLVETFGISQPLDPKFAGSVSLESMDRAKAFSVYNKLERRITTFVIDEQGETIGWTASVLRKTFKTPAFSRILGLKPTCGCGTARGRVFLGEGTKVYQYGNDVFDNERYTGDKVGEYDSVWEQAVPVTAGQILKDPDSDKIYRALISHVSNTIENDEAAGRLLDITDGQYINFAWELPWTSLGMRARKKRLSYIQIDTGGTAQFTLQAFVDNYYLDRDGNFDPATSFDFVGGDSQGYGNQDQPYGGGRRTKDERPWKNPADFKILKLRLSGSSNKPLNIATLTIIYYIGTYFR